jgi:hypothetical protein
VVVIPDHPSALVVGVVVLRRGASEVVLHHPVARPRCSPTASSDRDGGVTDP